VFESYWKFKTKWFSKCDSIQDPNYFIFIWLLLMNNAAFHKANH